ncbi:hypothetical protein Vadar_006488 [Vaccinium darrowii]|uniref:Uncharacterized protein n=1 Tax=Vaccinium darrowii TaxID=229202 RepID=A0ACB7XX96_9ERIC|nr:hypothetical protein Vadar_006488 [Vaccinium darrowii]
MAFMGASWILGCFSQRSHSGFAIPRNPLGSVHRNTSVWTKPAVCRSCKLDTGIGCCNILRLVSWTCHVHRTMLILAVPGGKTRPLCTEEMDLTDQQLKPCKCGYEICIWCWHHIMDMAEKNETEGQCPTCRTLYKEKIVGTAAKCERLVTEMNMDMKMKSQKPKGKTSNGRKQLSHSYVDHLKERILKDQMPKDPTEVVHKSILCIPRNKLLDNKGSEQSKWG